MNPTEEKNEEEKSEEEVEEMWEGILEKDPKNVEALKVVLYGKIRRGKSKEAVKVVEDLIAAEPNEVEWRLLLALCYETMGQLSKAKRLFREILKKRPLLVRALHVMFLSISFFWWNFKCLLESLNFGYDRKGGWIEIGIICFWLVVCCQ